jgi:pantoate kinase
MIMFDCTVLKDKIKNCSGKCLSELFKLMPELLFAKSKSFAEKLSEMNLKIAIVPTAVDQYVKYQKSVQEIVG